MEGRTGAGTLRLVGVTSGEPSHPAVVAVRDTGGVRVPCAVLVQKSGNLVSTKCGARTQFSIFSSKKLHLHSKMGRVVVFRGNVDTK